MLGLRDFYDNHSGRLKKEYAQIKKGTKTVPLNMIIIRVFTIRGTNEPLIVNSR